MTFTVENLHDLLELLEREPTWLAEVRRVVLTKELLTLPEQLARIEHDTTLKFQQLMAAQDRTDEQLRLLTIQVAELTVAQRRTDEQLAALTQAQNRTDEQLAALTQTQNRMEEQLIALTQAHGRVESDLRQVVNWQRGEAGRREGERYEHDIIRQAPALFNGGEGGPTHEATVQRRLTTLLKAVLDTLMANASANPFLVDVAWWKGEEMAVVEISRHVDHQDVIRVAQRAATLRRCGVEVMAVVLGEHWATEDTRAEAEEQQVEWKVGSELSPGFISFRRR